MEGLIMKTKITKKVKQELKNILDNTGYWSNETREYIEQFDFISRNKLHSAAQVYNKYKYGL
jgi:hypothetical protein